MRHYSGEHDNRTARGGGPVIDVDEVMTDEEVPAVRGASRAFENFRVTIKNSDDGAAPAAKAKKSSKRSKANNKPVSVSSGDGTPR